MSKARLEAFSDCVFAVAITLLVLDVRPEGQNHSGWEMLVNDWRKILVYLLSFVVVGVYWVAHHHMMHFVKGTDRTFLWINLLLLLFIVFIPYVAAVLSASHADPSAIRIYSSTLIFTNLTSSALWHHATKGQRLVSSSLPPAFARFVLVVNSAPILVYGLAAGIASFSIIASLTMLVLVPVFFILPHRFIEKRIDHAAAILRGGEGKPFEE